MNANHARPMLAFCLLAVVAALITAFGLSEGGRVTVRPASPEPVRTSGTPGLVLSDLLRARPSTGSTPAGTAWSSATALDLIAGPGSLVSAGPTVAGPVSPSSARSHSGGGQPGTSRQPAKSEPKPTLAAKPTTASPAPGKSGGHAATGKGHGKAVGHAGDHGPTADKGQAGKSQRGKGKGHRQGHGKRR